MLFLAATTLEKLKAIPPAFWAKVAIVILGVIAVVFVFRYVLNMNKFVLGVVIFIGVAIFGVKMVYERSEPAFLTPLVEKVAPFLPSAGAYDNKQGAPAKH